MKTLLNPENRNEVVSRLSRIRPETPRLWGKMSSHQMICHLSDGFKLYLGMIQAKPPGFPYPSRVLRFACLWVPIRWPRGFKTVPEVDQQVKGTAPGVFEQDMELLNQLVNRFVQTPPGLRSLPHPYLGRMSEREWGRLGYLHADHHLRQFRA